MRKIEIRFILPGRLLIKWGNICVYMHVRIFCYVYHALFALNDAYFIKVTI